jgi:hypothetical protein
LAVKSSKPKTSKKQKPEKRNSPPKKRKSVTSKTNNNNVRTKNLQQRLINQAAQTGNQTTVDRINNALAKASARVNRRYAGIPKIATPAQPSIGIAPAFNIQFSSMGADYDNGMREVNGMRNDIINEFRRLNPNAA